MTTLTKLFLLCPLLVMRLSSRVALLLLTCAVWVLPYAPWLASVRAAAAYVQETTCAGNDVTCTFAAAPLATNIVLVALRLGDEAQTIDITGWPNAETVSLGPVDSSTGTARGYLFCMVGDGLDTTFVATSSGAATPRVAAVEVSGIWTTCTTALDDAEVAADFDCQGSGTTAHSLATVLTTSAAGDFIWAYVLSSNTANFTAGSGYTSVPSGNGEINSNAQAEWKVAGASGSAALRTACAD